MQTLNLLPSDARWVDEASTWFPMSVFRKCSVPKLESIQGHEHVKRALEVALVCSHRVTLLSDGNPQTTMRFATWGRAYGLPVATVFSCFCGNSGKPNDPCVCSEQLKLDYPRSDGYLSAMRADMVLTVPFGDGAKATSPEAYWTDQAVFRRVALGVEHMIDHANRLDLDDPCRKLKARFIQAQIGATTGHMDAVLRVARSIASLALSPRIRAEHYAEALTYQGIPVRSPR